MRRQDGKAVWLMGLALTTCFGTVSGAHVAGTEWNTTLQIELTYKRNCPSLKSLRQHSISLPGTLSFSTVGGYSLRFRDGRTFSAGTYAQTSDNLTLSAGQEFLNRKNIADYLPAGMLRRPVLKRMAAGKRRQMPLQSRFTGVASGDSLAGQSLTLEERRDYRFANPDGGGQSCGNRLSIATKVRGISLIGGAAP